MEVFSSTSRRQILFGGLRRAQRIDRRLGAVTRVAPGFLAAWVVLQIPRIAEACAVCSAGRDEENAAAFLISTIFMSLLPLIAIGSIVYVLWRRIQKFEAEKEARLDAGATRATPTASPRAGSA